MRILILSMIRMETTGSAIHCCQSRNLLRAQLGTETDLGLKDALVANPSSSAVDYFSDVFNLAKFNTSFCT